MKLTHDIKHLIASLAGGFLRLRHPWTHRVTCCPKSLTET